jgi:hypothetical protein
MKKYLTAALAALTLGGSIVAGAAPASAEPGHWGGGYHGGYHGGWGGGYRGGYRGPGYGGVLAAGVLGLGLGAVIGGQHYYYAPPPAYYAGPSYYGYYGGCRHVWSWDGYRYVPVRECY